VNSVIAQTSVVYKRNPATSVLEVYQSSGGLPVGSPIYKIKKNVYGYLEVEDVQVSNDPFTLKPDYKAYNNFKPYQLPAKEIFETLETLNKRIEYDRFVSNPPKQNSNLVLDRLNANIDSRTRTATAFLKFYSSFIKFPETLKDGWYNVTKIEESASLDNLGIKGGTDFKYGICKVTKNKVVEYYENIHVLDSKESNVFVKVSLALSSNVTNCKATVKRNDFNNYETIYFLDNLVDAETQAENPGFSYYSIFTPPDLIKPGHVIYIKRNESITVAEVSKGEGFPYLSILGVNNASSYPCNSSLMTLAFKKIKVSSYSVGIMNLSDQRIWLVNQIRFNSIGTCQSTILSTQ
jgi:hypothetical protein